MCVSEWEEGVCVNDSMLNSLHLSRLSAAEQDLNTSQGGVEELRSEFTKRIGTTEKKLQTIIKVNDYIARC